MRFLTIALLAVAIPLLIGCAAPTPTASPRLDATADAPTATATPMAMSTAVPNPTSTPTPTARPTPTPRPTSAPATAVPLPDSLRGASREEIQALDGTRYIVVGQALHRDDGGLLGAARTLIFAGGVGEVLASGSQDCMGINPGAYDYRVSFVGEMDRIGTITGLDGFTRYVPNLRCVEPVAAPTPTPRPTITAADAQARCEARFSREFTRGEIALEITPEVIGDNYSIHCRGRYQRADGIKGAIDMWIYP